MNIVKDRERSVFAGAVRKLLMPGRVAEIGVGPPHMCQLRSLCGLTPWEVVLAEPHPLNAENLRNEFGKFGNVTIHELAIGRESGKGELVSVEMPTETHPKAGIALGSSYMSTVTAPPARKQPWFPKAQLHQIPVKIEPMGAIDDGSFVAVAIDVEGAEMDVLDTMVSRPKLVALELRGGGWQHAHRGKIEAWCRGNEYRPYYKTPSDVVYMRH